MGNHDTNPSRRELLKGAGLAAAALGTGLVFSANAAEVDHSMMHHDIPIDPKLEELMDYVLECIKMGEICNQHCMHMFQMGDTSLADCSISVQELIASCNAVLTLAAHNSQHLKAFVEAGLKVCESCEQECKKHADDHIQCKDCAEACGDCIEFCKEFLAA
jgi:Cys-rich four helix bundle protein (predicted Tat secretion target)